MFALDREASNEDEFRTIYQHLRTIVKERFRVETDNTFDPARACFLSHDPDLHLNEYCRLISTAKYINLNLSSLTKRPSKSFYRLKAPVIELLRLQVRLVHISKGAL